MWKALSENKLPVYYYLRKCLGTPATQKEFVFSIKGKTDVDLYRQASKYIINVGASLVGGKGDRVHRTQKSGGPAIRRTLYVLRSLIHANMKNI